MSEDTPILGGEPDEQDKLFCEACDKLKEQFGLECMVVAAEPKQKEGEQMKELVYLSVSNNPLFVIETSGRLIDFYVAKELREYEKSRAKALGMLGFLEKIVAGKMNKPQN
jgi:hypothetical protein